MLCLAYREPGVRGVRVGRIREHPVHGRVTRHVAGTPFRHEHRQRALAEALAEVPGPGGGGAAVLGGAARHGDGAEPAVAAAAGEAAGGDRVPARLAPLEAAVLPVLPRHAARAGPCREAAALPEGAEGAEGAVGSGRSGNSGLVGSSAGCAPGASSPGAIRVGAPPPIRSGRAPARPAASVRLGPPPTLPPPDRSSAATVARPPATTTTPVASRALRRRGRVETRPVRVSCATQEPSPAAVRERAAPQPGQTIPGSAPR